MGTRLLIGIHISSIDNQGLPCNPQAAVREGDRRWGEDGGGKTALHMAAEYGHVAVVRFLLEKEVDIAAKT